MFEFLRIIFIRGETAKSRSIVEIIERPAKNIKLQLDLNGCYATLACSKVLNRIKQTILIFVFYCLLRIVI